MGFFVSIRKLNSNFKLQIFQGYFVITCNPLYSTLIVDNQSHTDYKIRQMPEKSTELVPSILSM